MILLTAVNKSFNQILSTYLIELQTVEYISCDVLFFLDDL